MIGEAACRGASSIVNAIASGRGAAVGISLETDAKVDIVQGSGGLRVNGSEEEDGLVAGCVRRVAEAVGAGEVAGSVEVMSEIPISRGLKSSSAVTNAVVLATLRSLGEDLPDDELLSIGIDESIRAGVTVTGAFDDSAACFHGGVVVTDNRRRRVLRSDTIDGDLVAVIHVPDRMIPKSSVDATRFAERMDEFEKALDLAFRGEYPEATRLNSRLCAEALDLSDEVAEAARAKGAYAAGITGTGPATVALCQEADVDAITTAMRAYEGDIITTSLNQTCSREVVPRLL